MNGKHTHTHPSWLGMTSSKPELDLILSSPFASIIDNPKGEISRNNSSRDFRETVQAATADEDSLQNFYGYAEESDGESEISQDAPWDKDSYNSEDSDSFESTANLHKRGGKSPNTLTNASMSSHVQNERNTSLARLRTQLEENNMPRPSQGGRSSGTVVSITIAYKINNTKTSH